MRACRPEREGIFGKKCWAAFATTYRQLANALPEDMRALRRYVLDDEMREALDHAPPGIIDPRSWAYWNTKMHQYPAPPIPVRKFGETAG
jgi:hypothetical protein